MRKIILFSASYGVQGLGSAITRDIPRAEAIARKMVDLAPFPIRHFARETEPGRTAYIGYIPEEKYRLWEKESRALEKKGCWDTTPPQLRALRRRAIEAEDAEEAVERR